MSIVLKQLSLAQAASFASSLNQISKSFTSDSSQYETLRKLAAHLNDTASLLEDTGGTWAVLVQSPVQVVTGEYTEQELGLLDRKAAIAKASELAAISLSNVYTVMRKHCRIFIPVAVKPTAEYYL